MALHEDDVILNGKYHIVRLIGKGGMARVWLAEEPRFGNRQVAIKEPREDLLPDMAQEVRTRYHREVQVCAALAQAKVLNVVGAITTELYEDALLLVMEQMPGGDLASLLKRHPGGLPVEWAVSVAMDILEALEGVHAHELEIVHRDIKPSNILFKPDPQAATEWRAHLGDFGLAQLAGASGRSQLQGGEHPGTPMYMAPEQAASPQPLLPAADLYALGCILFEMLTGKRYKRVRPGTQASSLSAEVPGWLDEVLVRALAEDAWDRYVEASEMAVALVEGGEADRLEAEAQQQAPVWKRIGIEMVRIPEGAFLYGQKKQRVHLPEYYLSRTPVTNTQYEAFVDAMGHRLPDHWSSGTIPGGKEDHPVVEVDWADATAFCQWAGCRLPTDQEWEKGARGSDGREYPWGDDWELGRCNTKEAGVADTTPVGRYPNGASPYGLLDMAGNVREWCENWYDNDRKSKVLRGGSWSHVSRFARSAFRNWYYPDNRVTNLGFRCGLSPTSSP